MPQADPKLLFGSRVRQLRRERGWSQEEFAHRAGIDRSYMGGVERGERNVSLENICLIAAALGVPPAELFTGWRASGERPRNVPPSPSKRRPDATQETPPARGE
jgi:transcriptional regulator with XRE-family HTH domain